ncbi:MAG: CpaD family pilus assembly protein [Proteobacteria bacterium]|nr:CpaD family pilus assembly protein [Pseudomonadota bacterium]
MKKSDLVRAAAVSAVLLAGSCAAPFNDGTIVADPLVNHPITVEPGYRSMQISFTTSGAGLTNDDALRFDAFVQDYVTRGNGAISISAPKGPTADAAIAYFGERLATAGVPRSQILVGTHDVVSGDTRVEIGYVSYVAHTDSCGDWSKNAANVAANLPMPDFGCATQHNVAEAVADPRDLVSPRGMGDADADRRGTVLGHYKKGEITSSDKRKGDLSNEQSGTASDVH